MDEKQIAQIVAQVVARLAESKQQAQASAPASAPPATAPTAVGRGIYRSVNEAAERAAKAQKILAAMSLDERERLIDAIRQTAIAHAEELAGMAVTETGLGRYEDKIVKNKNAARLTPGTEDLPRHFISGAQGSTLTVGAPYGVICSVLPATHPTAIVINHAIIMIAGGNAMFACPHPRAANSSRYTISLLNQAITAAGGPEDLLVALDRVSMDLVAEVMAHPLVAMVTVAGGPAAVRAALTCGKRAVAAGPGNPPVLVDDTADPAKAARDIVNGAVFDNNILCIAEKVVFATPGIYDALLMEMKKAGCYLANAQEAEAITRLVVKDGHINGEFVGKDAAVILKAAGIAVPGPAAVRGVVFAAPFTHPLVKIEQMMPVLPVVKVDNFEQGMALAKEAECGFRHTALIHSNNIEHIDAYIKTMSTSIVVVNGPCYAGLGIDGAAVFTHTVASTTGEGVCTPRTFTKQSNATYCGCLTKY
ncbi:MAG TPA: aldehyde dehydrogenase [Firmicutes bacterium]|nr:aldehyde dehydrogenase [Bacillota bacterium]